eukprot:11186048-Karenia_brevis.AAC.2
MASPSCQYGGGCHSGSTAVANLLARTHTCIGVSSKMSVIQLFIDLKTAFATMVKALAVPLESED